MYMYTVHVWHMYMSCTCTCTQNTCTVLYMCRYNNIIINFTHTLVKRGIHLFVYVLNVSWVGCGIGVYVEVQVLDESPPTSLLRFNFYNYKPAISTNIYNQLHCFRVTLHVLLMQKSITVEKKCCTCISTQNSK